MEILDNVREQSGTHLGYPVYLTDLNGNHLQVFYVDGVEVVSEELIESIDSIAQGVIHQTADSNEPVNLIDDSDEEQEVSSSDASSSSHSDEEQEVGSSDDYPSTSDFVSESESEGEVENQSILTLSTNRKRTR